MKTRVQKWGHSLAVRLPKSFADELSLGEGSPAEVGLEDRAIIVRPDRDRAWDLETLLAGVTDENIHAAWDAEEPGTEGDRRGRDGAR